MKVTPAITRLPEHSNTKFTVLFNDEPVKWCFEADDIEGYVIRWINDEIPRPLWGGRQDLSNSAEFEKLFGKVQIIMEPV